MIPIYVVSKGERFHTFQMLNEWGVRYTTVTHTMAQRMRLLPHVAGNRIVVTGLRGLLKQRNFILEDAHPGMWYIGMDDNIRCFTELMYPWRKQPKIDVIGTRPREGLSWAKAFKGQVNVGRFWQLVDNLIRECHEQRTIYGGFASADVAMYRQRMWSYRRFVKSKFFVMRNVPGLRWQGGNVAHDSWMSAYCVHTYGSVAVYNYAHPVHKMFESGGLGTLAERRNQLDVELGRIIKQFPGLVRRADGPNAALAFIQTRRTK